MASACYVYAVVRRTAQLPSRDSAATAGLTLVPWRELAAVVGRIGDDAAPQTVDAVLHHEAVVEAVRRRGPALPVRFGTVFRDAASVAVALAERYDSLVADLARLGDKVELGLTALWSTPPSDDAPAAMRADRPVPNGAGAGARYMHARAAELRREAALKERARTIARELDHVLGARVIERRVTLLPAPRVVVRTAYLLDPADVSAFRAAFEGAHRARVDVRVLLTGPWPPYSFVTRAQSEGAPAQDGRFAELARLLTDATGGRPG